MARPAGVVDTLTAGYGVINRRLWVVFIPVVLDLFIWLGPRLSVEPMMEEALASPRLVAALAAGNSDSAENVRAALRTAGKESNLAAFLSVSLAGVPTIMGGPGRSQGQAVPLDSGPVVLGIIAGLFVVGSLVGCLYRAAIASSVRHDEIGPLGYLAEGLRAWFRLIGLVFLFAVAGVAVGLPLILVAAAIGLVSRELAAFGAAVITSLVLLASLYLFFAPDAIFVSRHGPLSAMRASVRVVKSHAWSAMWLIALVSIMLLGMALVWAALAARTPWGTITAIVGNAYVASGIIAGTMLFYRDRYQLYADAAA